MVYLRRQPFDVPTNTQAPSLTNAETCPDFPRYDKSDTSVEWRVAHCTYAKDARKRANTSNAVTEGKVFLPCPMKHRGINLKLPN